jgi:Lysyl oxidase
MRVWLGVVCGVAACACAGGAGGARTAMPALLLPDLDQRAPQQVQVVWGGPPDHLQARLAFATNVEDLGWGPLVVVGRRSNLRVKTIRAEQYVWRGSGGSVRVARVGRLHYNVNPSHQHWHLQPFEVYELRTLDGQRLVRDHKNGFCLTSDWATDQASLGPIGTRPIGTTHCQRNNRRAKRVLEGIEVGYGDIYSPLKEGQYVDVSGVPYGDYDLVNRVNVDRKIREVSYANNDASLRIRLLPPAAPGDPPGVKVLNVCETGSQC